MGFHLPIYHCHSILQSFFWNFSWLILISHFLNFLTSTSIFFTARLRWRGLRNGLFVLGKLFWIPQKFGQSLHCLQVFPENSVNRCSMSTKIVEFNACPRNSWKLLLCIHENSGIQCLSTKIVEFTAACTYTKLLDFSSVYCDCTVLL